MTRLRVYRGPETNRGSRFSSAERPGVIPFSALVARHTRLAVANAALDRAKALHSNRSCRNCGCSGVEPVTLNDGLRDGSGQYVPGSATLVGFHCTRCRSEWPVYGE
jgi:hypothetical protein